MTETNKWTALILTVTLTIIKPADPLHPPPSQPSPSAGYWTSALLRDFNRKGATTNLCEWIYNFFVRMIQIRVCIKRNACTDLRQC